MKKTYIAPSVKVVKVNSQNILAGSVTTNNKLGSGNQLGKQNLDDDDWDD